MIDPFIKSLYIFTIDSIYGIPVSKVLPITVKILNKPFQVACPAGTEAALLASAQYLDQKMREIRSKGRVIGLERIAIMAALNIAHELLTVQQQSAQHQETISVHLQGLQSKIDAVLLEEVDEVDELDTEDSAYMEFETLD